MIEAELSTTSEKELPIFTKLNQAKKTRDLELSGVASAEPTATLVLSWQDSTQTYPQEQLELLLE